MATDPKATIVALINANIPSATYPLKRNDASTNCVILACYDMPEEEIASLLGTYDVIFTVKQGEGEISSLGLSTITEKRPVFIEIWVADKILGKASTEVVYGTKTRWSAKDSLIKLIQAKATTAGGSIHVLRLLRDNDEDITDSEPILFHSLITCETWIER